MHKGIVIIFLSVMGLLFLFGCPQNPKPVDSTPNPIWVDQNFLRQFKENPGKAFDENSILLDLDSNSIQLNFDINLSLADQNFVADVCSVSCQYVYADPARISEALPSVDLENKTFPKSIYELFKNKKTNEYSWLCTWRVCNSETDPEFPGQLFCTDNSKKYSVSQNS